MAGALVLVPTLFGQTDHYCRAHLCLQSFGGNRSPCIDQSHIRRLWKGKSFTSVIRIYPGVYIPLSEGVKFTVRVPSNE